MNELALWDDLVGTADPGGDVDIGHAIWRETPVGLEEFVTSKAHLGIPDLYPLQQLAIRELLGDDPTRIFEPGRLYQLAVLLWGKGSGKDYLCSILVCYLVHVLLCLRDPQAYFGFGPGEPIDIVNVAYNADQAKFVFFAKLKLRLLGWQWLQDRYNVFESGRAKGKHQPGRAKVEINDNHVLFPNSVRAFSRHAQNESYEGLNIIAWIMDEASAFLSKTERENAEAIYSTLRTSANSRFPGRWVGAIISYPRHGDDFTMTKLRAARVSPRGIYADGPRKTWEVNTRIAGDRMVEARPGHWVPAELANDYIDDFEGSVAKYECDPPAARDAFFRFPDRLDSAVQKGRLPLIEWAPSVTHRTVEMLDDQGRAIQVNRRYSAVELGECRKLPKGAKLYFHGDPGLVNDSFALAIAHAAPATIMVWVPASEVLTNEQMARHLARGGKLEEPIEWERDVARTIVDAVIVWRPDPKLGQQVDALNVRDTIFALKKRYPTLGFRAPTPTGTFDHWESGTIVQEMIGKRMNVENESWSRPFQVDMYRAARSQFYNDLVTLPDTPSITSEDPLEPGALHELKRLEFIDGSKVDHPEGGSKDIADAVARVILHVVNAVRKGFVWGTMHGHQDQYPGHAPMVPSPAPRVDPTRAPSPVTDAEREAQQAKERVAPTGELVPADATINGRRFGVIRSG